MSASVTPIWLALGIVVSVISPDADVEFGTNCVVDKLELTVIFFVPSASCVTSNSSSWINFHPPAP